MEECAASARWPVTVPAPALRIASCDAPPASEEEELRLDSSNAPATCDQVVGGVLAPLLHLHLNLLVCHGLAADNAVPVFCRVEEGNDSKLEMGNCRSCHTQRGGARGRRRRGKVGQREKGTPLRVEVFTTPLWTRPSLFLANRRAKFEWSVLVM